MRCKPGDLAVIIDAFNCTNVGRIVKVVRLHDGGGSLAMASSPNVWLVHCAQPLTWTIGDVLYRRKNGPAPDAQLQPIRGDAHDSIAVKSIKRNSIAEVELALETGV
jgi:hypothetical protein